MRAELPQTHEMILERRLAVVAAAGMLQSDEYVMRGMTEAATTRILRNLVRARLEIREARAMARWRRVVEFWCEWRKCTLIGSPIRTSG